MSTINFQTPPSCIQKNIEDEFSKIPPGVYEDIKHLKLWLTKQPHLRFKDDDHRLLSFLRGTKFSLERAKQKIELFYTARTVLPEILSNRDPFLPEIQDILRSGCIIPLPTTNKKGERIILLRSLFDPAKITGEHVFKTTSIFTDILLNEDDNFVIAGVRALVDMTSTTMEHCTIFPPRASAKLIKIWEKAYPIRIKGAHYVNVPGFFDVIYHVFKNVLPEKLTKKITLTPNSYLECEDVPLKLLPNEYGGEAGSIDLLAKQWKEKVESYREWLLEEDKYCSIEEKRLEKLPVTQELFGTDGSFRKLEVD